MVTKGEMMTTHRVVVAEDEPLIRLDLCESLAEEGYDVVGEAGDGAQALDLVRDLKPDVAILDIKMPNVDGLTAAREIIGQRMAAVVILTAFSQRDLVEQARDAGVLSYMVKPFQSRELVPAIELAIARFREIVALSSQAETLSDQLENRKTIDRAKGRLMDDHSMTEQQAFRFLQTTAMSSRSSMKAVADQIISGELAP
jgi:response regulator NasT